MKTFAYKITISALLCLSAIAPVMARADLKSCGDQLTERIYRRYPASSPNSLALSSKPLRAILSQASLSIEENNSGFVFATGLTLKHGDQVIARAAYSKQNASMRVDVNVDSGYRKLGVYGYLMRYIIEANPEVDTISSSVGYINSTNGALFLQSAFAGPTAYLYFVSKGVLASQPEKNLALYRQRIVDAVRKTPAFRVRQNMGFANLTRIILRTASDMTKDALAFEVKKGPISGSNQVEVLVEDRGLTNHQSGLFEPSHIYRILPWGALVNLGPKIDNRHALLGDYDYLPVPIGIH